MSADFKQTFDRFLDTVDSIMERLTSLVDRFDVSYTDYIRTTEERHAEAVKNVWLALEVIHLLLSSKLGVSHFFSFKEER